MSPAQQKNLLDALHRWGPWLGALLLFVILTTGKAVLGYADERSTVEKLAERTSNLETQQALIGRQILKRLDRLDKASARITCKLDGPGANCDAALAAIGDVP